MKTSELDLRVLRWIDTVEAGEFPVCREQTQLAAYVRRCFEREDIYTYSGRLDNYLKLTTYFPFECLFPWEAFCIALHLCTFWRDTGMPRWPDLFLLIGRGAGKDGYIAYQSLCLTSPYSNLPRYDVDICATAEDVAMRPISEDLIGVLEDPRHTNKLKKHFYWTKEKVVGLKYRGVIRGRTNNPKSKDGMRSGEVVFNEVHQYENYKNIKVFTTGLGKKKHPRRLYATTQGDVREGPLDELLARSEQILQGEADDNGLLPFICRLDDKKEADDRRLWVKANPSLPYLPDLMAEIEKEYADWKQNPAANADFMTKRMNRPQSDTEVAVTDWANIIATKRELPELSGRACTAGIDYASINDFASVNLHFREGEQRYDINHSWLCLQSKELFRLQVPWREWAEQGYITLVDDVDIPRELLCNWILENGQRYQIKKLALDNYRYGLMAESLRAIGFDAKDTKNVKLVQPSDIMKIVPVIGSAFDHQLFSWGDNPPLRWAANNTKLARSSRKLGSDTGNFFYAKIEAKTRKTDPFMALAASMTIEEELGNGAGSAYDDLPVIIG